MAEPSHTERIDGPTPAGGAYSVAHFADADGNPCPKARARRIEVIEYDASGRAIRRTHLQKD